MTIKARVLELNGKLQGIAGYWEVDGETIVFSDVAADAEITPIRIWREAQEFMKQLDRPARCLAGEGSERFLTRLGWEHLGSCDEGEIFEWQC